MKVKVRNRKLKGKARRGTTVVTEKEVTPRSPFMGSRLTVANRRAFLESQKEIFIQNQQKFYEDRRTEIMEQEGTDEEKQFELQQLEDQKYSKESLEKKARLFATFQANKEVKHYKAYLAGQLFYKYKGQIFPVVTEESLMRSRKLINIQQTEEDGKEVIGVVAGGSDESIALDPVPTGDEGRVGETV